MIVKLPIGAFTELFDYRAAGLIAAFIHGCEQANICPGVVALEAITMGHLDQDFTGFMVLL